MRAHFAFFVFTGLGALTTACSDDTGQTGDTIVDTSDVVDTSDTSDSASDGDSAGDTDTSPPLDTTDTTPTDTRPDGEVVQTLAVVVNELAASGDPLDWIELYNAGEGVADITGWLLRDDDPAHAYVFAPGTKLAKGAYLVVERDDTGAAGFNFGLGGADAVYLYDADDDVMSQTSWNDGESPIGRSWGRIPNGSGDFKTLLTPSKGAANIDNPASTCGNDQLEGLETCDTSKFGDVTCKQFGWGGGNLSCIESCTRISQSGCTARAAGLVINELESDEADRIELFNGGPIQIDLAGFTLADGGGGTYLIPEDTLIAAGGYVVFERDINHTFGLGDDDSLELRDTDDEVVDAIAWGAGRAVPAYCRTPNGTGGFRTCDEQTFGNDNF